MVYGSLAHANLSEGDRATVFGTENGAEAVSFREVDSASLLSLEGVWRSRGYGWLWQISDGRIRIYDAVESYCVHRETYFGIPEDFSRSLGLHPGGAAFSISIGDETYRYRFDRIGALPAACGTEDRSGPEAIFETAVAIFTEHYPFFRERDVAWSETVEFLSSQVSPDLSEEGLFALLSRLLSQIDDGHIGLSAMVEGRERWFSPPFKLRQVSPEAIERSEQVGYWTTGIASELSDNLVRVSNGQIQYGTIEDTAYLYIGSTGRSLRRAVNGPLDEARALFRREGSKRLIIDLTDNTGGTDETARRFVARFARSPVVAYSKRAGDTVNDPLQAAWIEPADPPIFEGPVTVITNQETISAGEILLMGLRSLPNIDHIGMATRGSLSDILTKRLPNGWSLDLANEIYLDHEGRFYEGIGIPPDVEIPIYSKQNAPDDAKEAAKRLIDYLDSF
nr:hypothetical protein [Fulvimarina pelagi]